VGNENGKYKDIWMGRGGIFGLSIKNRESDVEKYMVTRLGESTIPCVKFLPYGIVGMPDRIILLPDSKVMWVELKTDNGRLSDVQRYRHKKLKDSGQDVRVIWNREDVDELVAEITEIKKTVHQV